jgi:hypothetical protein
MPHPFRPARRRALGAEAGGQPPEVMQQFVTAEITKWSKAVKDSGAKLD